MNDTFVAVVGVVALVSTAVIVLLVGLRSVLEIAHIFNFLPQRLANLFFRTREERAVRDALERLGVLDQRPHVKQVARLSKIGSSELDIQFREVTLDLIKDHLRVSRRPAFSIGRDLRVGSPYYIALREFLVDLSAARSAARLVLASIRNALRQVEPGAALEFDAVAGHRDGSPLLAAAVADQLGLPTLLFGERAYVQGGDGAPRSVEGTISAGISAILVDDSTTDGRMLLDLTNALRSLEVTVQHAFVLFYRTEGQAREILQRNGVELHAVVDLGAEELSRLKKRK